MKTTRWAVLTNNKHRVLMSQDEDGHAILPLFISEGDAMEAAERSDLDEYEVVEVTITI